MRTLFTMLLGATLLTCSSKTIDDGGWDIVLKGKVNFPQPGAVTIREMRSDGAGRTDTIHLNGDGSYQKTLHMVEPGNYYMNFFNVQILNIVLNKSNVEINVDGNNRQGFAEIKGSPEHDLITKAQNLQREIQQSSELAGLQQEFNDAAQANNQAKMEEIRARFMGVLKKGNDKIAALLLEQPASIAVMDILLAGSFLDAEDYGHVYVDAAGKLKSTYPNSLFAKEFASQVEKMQALAIGKEAPEIALPNPEGTVVKLSSLRGKYVLVDFWAKWCGPCRRENPNVVKAFNRFKGKGFTVFGVSLDRSKEEWIQAIQQDGLTWTHVSDLKYFESEAARDYNIQAIPFSILLDKKGVIIAKNLRGPALEQKLEEVLGK